MSGSAPPVAPSSTALRPAVPRTVPAGSAAGPRWRIPVPSRVVDGLVAAGLVLLCCLLRTRGLGDRTAFVGDDAWVLLGAHAPWRDRVAMGSSSPGFAILTGLWSDLRPGSLQWAQLPSFVLGGTAVGATYVAGRGLRLSRPAALCGAVLILVGGNAIAYSVRIKQYSFDMTAAALVVAAAVAIARRPRWGRSIGFAVGSAVAVAASGSVVAVVMPAAVYLLVASGRGAGRRVPPASVLASVTALAAVLGSWWWFVLRRLPPSLSESWSARYLTLDPGSRELGSRWYGVVRGLFRPFAPVTWQWQAVAAAVALVLAVLVTVLPFRASRRPGLVVLPMTVVVAVAMSVARIAPLGGGRTDAFLYPTLALLGAALAEVPVVLAYAGRRRLLAAVRNAWARLTTREAPEVPGTATSTGTAPATSTGAAIVGHLTATGAFVTGPESSPLTWVPPQRRSEEEARPVRVPAGRRRVALAVLVLAVPAAAVAILTAAPTVAAGTAAGTGIAYARPHPPRYPAGDLPGVLAAVRRQARPGDLVIISPRERYVWALHSGDRYRRVFGDWTAGFTVGSQTPGIRVVGADLNEPGFSTAGAAGLAGGTRRVWFVASGRPDSRSTDGVQERVLARGRVWAAYLPFPGVHASLWVLRTS